MRIVATMMLGCGIQAFWSAVWEINRSGHVLCAATFFAIAVFLHVYCDSKPEPEL